MKKIITLKWDDETVDEQGIEAIYTLTEPQKRKRWDDDRFDEIAKLKKEGKKTEEIAQIYEVTPTRLLEKLRYRRGDLIHEALRNFHEVKLLGGKKTDFWFLNDITFFKEDREIVAWFMEIIK